MPVLLPKLLARPRPSEDSLTVRVRDSEVMEPVGDERAIVPSFADGLIGDEVGEECEAAPPPPRPSLDVELPCCSITRVEVPLRFNRGVVPALPAPVPAGTRTISPRAIPEL